VHKPNWSAIRGHYKWLTPKILQSPRNEWACDPYAWCEVATLTPIEDHFWCEVRSIDAVVYPQYPIGKHFVDFANPVAKVVFECDGAAFHLDQEKDDRRDLELVEKGWTVYRVAGWQCVQTTSEEGILGSAGRELRIAALRHRIIRSDHMDERVIDELAKDYTQISEKGYEYPHPELFI